MKAAATAGLLTLLAACSGAVSTPDIRSDGGTSGSSSSSSSGSSASSSGNVMRAIPQVIFSGLLANSPGKDCRDASQLFEVGDFGNVNGSPSTPATPVLDGAPWQQQGSVSVSCSVVASTTPGTFAVNATVVLTGATGGLFTIEGTIGAPGNSPNIHVLASSKRSANNYDEKDRACVVKIDPMTSQGIGPGRVWATVTCPNAVNTADDNRACAINAELRFENCTQ